MISYIVHADNMNSIRVHNLKNKRMNKDSNKKTNNCYNIFHLRYIEIQWKYVHFR